MFAEMEIKSNHIKEAEAILINGNTFDEQERVPFIKNLETRDLLAVPGSGKTTALQAKLYCLAKQMPFDDRSGILVLSHTNKAVEEIENKLKNHCPQLFEYPNFVGTVQSFVNRFLANTWCFNQYGSYIHINDDNMYEKAMRFFYTSLPWKPNNSTAKFLKNDLYRRANYGKDISTAEKEKNTIKYLCELKLETENNRFTYGSKNTTIFKLGGTTNDFFVCIKDYKMNLFSQGLITYLDSYNIANEYIIKNEEVKPILRKRFKYIFIDEAQDLEKYQLDIIESIFNNKGSDCVIQRIGDINQSIYNNGKSIKVECEWEPRNPLFLKSSLRLTKEVAEIVDCFTLKKDFVHNDSRSHVFSVVGKSEIEQVIRPHLIIFDNDTIDKLRPKFEELIRRHDLFDGLDGINTKRGYKIIGWSGIWKDEDSKGRLRLENIFPNEYKVALLSKKSKVSLCEYLICNSENIILKKYSDDIIDALTTVLRIAECMSTEKRNGKEYQRHYTSRTLWKYLVDESRKIDGKLSEHDVLDFKSKLYSWSFSIATNNNIDNTYNEIKLFVNDILSKWFEFEIGDKVADFVGVHYDSVVSESVNTHESTEQHIPIEICSVHSIKGQTHCATMYVETAYHDYETQKLIIKSKKETKNKPAEFYNNPLLKKKHNYKDDSCPRAKETIKMMYVGFSRPTHLLCFAVFRDNLTNEQLSYFKSNDSGWSVVDLTE